MSRPAAEAAEIFDGRPSVQTALSCCAFPDEDPDYPYFRTILPKVYLRRDTGTLAGLKVWPETSPLVDLPLKATTGSEGVKSGWASHIEPLGAPD